MPATVPSASPPGLMPPDDSRWGGPMVLALVAHALLAAALTWGIGWNRTQTPVVAEAELWSRLPQSAAPKLVEDLVPKVVSLSTLQKVLLDAVERGAPAPASASFTPGI